MLKVSFGVVGLAALVAACASEPVVEEVVVEEEVVVFEEPEPVVDELCCCKYEDPAPFLNHAQVMSSECSAIFSGECVEEVMCSK